MLFVLRCAMVVFVQRFYASNNDHVIDVNLDDSIDIICPHYRGPPTPANPYEYYIIYRVEKRNYDKCVINDTAKKMKILNCSTPNSEKPTRYTMLIVNIQPIQGNPDFHEGNSYYFISTSGGRRQEISNQYLGACHSRRMKMILRVIPRNNTKPATTRSPSTTSGGGVGTPRTTPTIPTPTTTTPRPTTSTKRSTTLYVRPTAQPGGGGGGAGGGGGDGFPNGDNVIIVGGGGGDKNEGTITDNAAHTLRSPPLLLLLPLMLLLLHVGQGFTLGVLR
ncbi:hypothetical protein ACOMHN_053317 [Nucella lapillus]